MLARLHNSLGRKNSVVKGLRVEHTPMLARLRGLSLRMEGNHVVTTIKLMVSQKLIVVRTFYS